MLGAIIGDIAGSRFEFYPTNDYNFEIGQFNSSDRVSMNMWRADEGWNLLGTFRFEADTVKVTLNNKSGVNVIVADAVKLVKRENSR